MACDGLDGTLKRPAETASLQLLYFDQIMIKVLKDKLANGMNPKAN
jgi:hypothetical protein